MNEEPLEGIFPRAFWLPDHLRYQHVPNEILERMRVRKSLLEED
jgi:hypothetical protein